MISYPDLSLSVDPKDCTIAGAIGSLSRERIIIGPSSFLCIVIIQIGKDQIDPHGVNEIHYARKWISRAFNLFVEF